MNSRLAREVGLPGAVLLGLGSILGTGVFVSIGIATAVAGPAVVLAIAVASLVATCNALSSAQLAANHPVSGGTYEYGYRYLKPAFGFSAGWLFLCAKSASAAAAALGFAAYTLNALGIASTEYRTPLALLAVIAITALVIWGMRRSNRVNAIVVSITILALAAFVVGGLPRLLAVGSESLVPLFGEDAESGARAARAFLHATALMFVAYTGYGRVATLGEEIKDPAHNIPRAIVLTLLISLVIYVSVGLVGVGSVGASAFAAATEEVAAPLEVVARQFGVPALPQFIAIGAVTAMLGVLLNLVLGLSRVVLAMARRGDMPGLLAKLDSTSTTPLPAVIFTGVIVTAIVLYGDIRVAWSFSAFTVLFYYAVTNLAALAMPAAERLYPRFVSAAGLVACVLLAFFVQREIWLVSLGILGVGLGWHVIARTRSCKRQTTTDQESHADDGDHTRR
ncbi:MAG: amino acid permease [Gemmatimonadota bacterium]|nr:MAG: amino acid permease [Gemmatimonadota bacterium]